MDEKDFFGGLRAGSVNELASLLPCGICVLICDEPATITYANDQFYSFFGFPSTEAAVDAGFTNLKCVLHDADYSSIVRKFGRRQDGDSADFEFSVRRLGGGKPSRITLRFRFRYLADEHRLVSAVFSAARPKSGERQFLLSGEEYKIAAEQHGNHVIRYDIRTKTEYRTEQTADFLGAPAIIEDVPDSVIASGAIAEESEAAYKGFFDAIQRGEPSGTALFKVRRDGKHSIWRHVEFTTIFDDAGEPLQAIITLADATEQHVREIAYIQHRQKIYDAVQNGAMYYEFNLTANVCEYEEGNSFPFFIASGQRSYTDFYAVALSSYIQQEHSEKFAERFSLERLIADFYNGIFMDTLDAPILNIDGEYKWMRATAYLIFDPYSSDIKALLLVEDIDMQKQIELQILSRLEVEPLTGLLTRITFIERVTQLICDSEDGAQHALVLLDIDNFKQINDRFGHIYGDKVLHDTAANLLSKLDKADIIGRYGGDEIIVFLSGVSREEAEKRVESLRAAVYKRISGGLMISGSLGVAMFPADGADYGRLCLNADTALYEAKRSGRNRAVFYTPSLQSLSPVTRITPVEEAVIASQKKHS